MGKSLVEALMAVMLPRRTGRTLENFCIHEHFKLRLLFDRCDVCLLEVTELSIMELSIHSSTDFYSRPHRSSHSIVKTTKRLLPQAAKDVLRLCTQHEKYAFIFR